jgi:formate hydrogenlyase subunit 3/multisubunit Na+/H+ antiporter MnhD subunit
MLDAGAVAEAISAGNSLLVLAIALPVAGVLIAFVLGGRSAERVALAFIPIGLGLSFAIFADVWGDAKALTYVLGGWQPPLGVRLRADGVSAVMLVATALTMSLTALFARAGFSTPNGESEARRPFVFWTLLLAVWAALNSAFLASDLFNIYVALELLTFAAVPLVCLDGRAETLAAALRYLLFALVGSILYLLGTALIYGAYGTLDIGLLAGHVRSEPATWIAIALMTSGLLAKTALFPLHLWLPPAHAGAPAAASAILSALVVKGSFFIIVRLWFDAMPGLVTAAAAQILATLGAAAVLFGSVLALRQARLKMLVAYSTVAQIGYLFLMFPLLIGSGAADAWNNVAWTGGWMQLVSHAFAKAAMFMAAGLIAEAIGHDRITGLAGIGTALPITVIAFAISGLSLMGIPPGGGFQAKSLLLTAATAEGQWWWSIIILAGGLLTAGYVFSVLAQMFTKPDGEIVLLTRISWRREAVVLALALCALLLGLVPLRPLDVLLIGRGPEAAFQ